MPSVRVFLAGAISRLDEAGCMLRISGRAGWVAPARGGTMSEGRKLRRSRNRVIAGVCGGAAEWLGWPAGRVRVVYVIVSILSAAFPGILVYIALWFLMPGPDSA